MNNDSTVSYAAAEPCDSWFQGLVDSSENISYDPPIFEHWNFGLAPTITPEQLLPKRYMDDIRRKFGEVKITVTRAQGGYPRFYFKVTTDDGKNEFMHWMLYSKGDPKELWLDNLKISTPFETSSSARLHQSQSKKGLPSTAFRFARNQLFALARAGGFDRISSGGAQNFTVQMLYRKMVGMEGRTLEEKQQITYMENLYQFSKTLPEDLRPHSLEDFAKSLMSYYYPFSVFHSDTELWKKSPQLFEHFDDSMGRTLAVSPPRASPNEPRRIYYLTRKGAQGDRSFVSWYENQSELTININNL